MATELTTVDLTAPVPTFRGAQMVEGLKLYRELQHALDLQMPDQLQRIQDKVFRKKGYWRALSVAFSVTVTVERDERSVVGSLDGDSENYCWTVTCRATAPTGRSVTGDGTCTASEKSRGKLLATEHNVRSHAHTRAFNRAVSNLVGFGEVSAEEIGDEPAPARPGKPVRRAAADPPATTPTTPQLTPTITPQQRARLFAIAGEVGWTREELKVWLATSKNIESTADITRAQYDALCQEIHAGGHRTTATD